LPTLARTQDHAEKGNHHEYNDKHVSVVNEGDFEGDFGESGRNDENSERYATNRHNNYNQHRSDSHKNQRKQFQNNSGGHKQSQRRNHGYGNFEPWDNTRRTAGGDQNLDRNSPTDLKREITFLTRNKNLKPNGGYWVELSQIDDRIANAPGFDIRNYIPEKQWQTTVNQAKNNLFAKKRNVVVNTREINRVRANLYTISAVTEAKT
jgi:hypothetical protein